MNIFERARVNVGPDIFQHADPLPHNLYNWAPPVQTPSERQYILRMMLRKPESPMLIPPELMWLQPCIFRASVHQEKEFNRNHGYVYITVRHGICDSVTDDEWHVDGFSVRKPHIPEQNYIYANHYPTEYLDQKFTIPKDFDPLKHDIQKYFAAMAMPTRIRRFWSFGWQMIDPYVVHRRPKEAFGKYRTMVRISFVPIEIEDSACTPNSLLPSGPYEKNTFRDQLVPYPLPQADTEE